MWVDLIWIPLEMCSSLAYLVSSLPTPDRVEIWWDLVILCSTLSLRSPVPIHSNQVLISLHMVCLNPDLTPSVQ